ncbi:apolipoprotein N-acyltransferase [Hydrogenimonas cancrithermarum]|uniref:Apolipoprotein N-acyltransferase n=1 Tax=Hydrogenimonas cancrithermarum TaxID=2993563 RepID=A0ABN6WWR6_9BACT|nr:apolipoprotein N-acyltransferase [Hydrogenimonas cancrithermarum]
MISLGFLSALCASAFIYLHHFGLHLPWFQAFLGIGALWFWLTLPPRAMFWSGFFTATLWFHWIGLSFRYYDLSWMIPFVVLGIALCYGFIFRLIAALGHIVPRAAAFGLVEYLHPFGFDWFRPALMFTGSILGDHLWQLWIVLATLALFIPMKHKARYAVPALFLFAIHHPSSTTHRHQLEQRIQLVQTNIDQAKKWDPRYRRPIVELNLQAIRNAIAEKKGAVILPESAFPLFLNHDIELMQTLMELSHDITIVTGALYAQKGKSYNSTYLFQYGDLRIMHKVVLVPFGEAVPLPKWLGHWINDLFFEGASDYTTAEKPSDFEMLGHTWRNAICYEATCDRLFEGNPKYMVAISNNAWFIPSIEPTLQRLLLQLQADRHGTTIFHATNGPITGIVEPD